MKNIFKITLALSLIIVLMSSCKEESDLILERVEAPVFLEYTTVSASEAQATFFDLDKSGILDQNVGIIYNPISGLEVEVIRDGVSLGNFTTDGDGSFLIPLADGAPGEFAGNYDGIAFRLFQAPQ
ncbi:MAG: hypothetical protein ACLFQ0_03725 [Cyclobacteriaceae bacterium]